MKLVPQTLLMQAARRFKLLSEPARLHLLNHLHGSSELSVQDLVEATGYQQANVSKHLALMARHGLLARRKEGLHVFYRIADPTVSAMCTLVCGQLRQEAMLAQAQPVGP